MFIKQIKLSQQARDKLARLKGKTGISSLNILCRWAFCYSLSEKTVPTDVPLKQDSNFELSWYTFGGDSADIYEALMKEWCIEMDLPTDDQTLAKYFMLNLERGINHLCATKFIMNLQDLLKLTRASHEYLSGLQRDNAN